MRLKDFINTGYLNEIKYDMISSKIFIPDVIRFFLTKDEIDASFDESLRERYGKEKMDFRDKISSIYIALDLLNFIITNDWWGLIIDKTAFLNFLKRCIDEDLEMYSDEFSTVEKRKYTYDYNLFLKLYSQHI